jgi:DNA polymerase III subunit epsilon
MAREIVLDVETTGIGPREGHRIIEIGCVEINGYIPTGRHFHTYVHPERDIDPDAERVHGISLASLEGMPTFSEPTVADALIEFVGEADLIAHNAAFDRDFVNHELKLAGRPILAESRWIDTLPMAQKRFPGLRNSLDALCKRFNISLAEREKHGALVDAKLLARVYLELRGGRERTLDLAGGETARTEAGGRAVYGPRPRPLAARLSDAEAAAHAEFVSANLKDAIWLR